MGKINMQLETLLQDPNVDNNDRELLRTFNMQLVTNFFQYFKGKSQEIKNKYTSSSESGLKQAFQFVNESVALVKSSFSLLHQFLPESALQLGNSLHVATCMVNYGGVVNE